MNIFFIFYFTLPEAYVFLSALNLSSLPWLTDICKLKTVGLQHVCLPKGNCCLVFSCDLFGKLMSLGEVFFNLPKLYGSFCAVSFLVKTQVIFTFLSNTFNRTLDS